MKLIKIKYDKENNNIDKKNFFLKIKSLWNNNFILILLIINFIVNNFLLIENKKNSILIKEILDFKNSLKVKNISIENYYPNGDKEMIGLYYPVINFDSIKANLKNFGIIRSFSDLINQLEIKLIYLEKEINITKIISFYTSRKFFLKQKNITYSENKLKELHDIINWIIIHKSNQLKGIASDKYLACKYVKFKLGKNLCKQRIAVYNEFEELNYTIVSKYGDIALKISNSCWKTIFISHNATIEIFKDKIKKLKRYLQTEHGLLDRQFFHLYSRKRIIVEKQFIPRTDLYEFKFFIVNNAIKFIYLLYHFNKKFHIFIYDTNFNFLYKEKSNKSNPLNITSLFKKKVLNKLKDYAIKLSEDFPNFIRVDLYFFHDKIYFSELTFASYNGFPMLRDQKFVKDALANFSRIDDYY